MPVIDVIMAVKIAIKIKAGVKNGSKYPAVKITNNWKKTVTVKVEPTTALPKPFTE